MRDAVISRRRDRTSPPIHLHPGNPRLPRGYRYGPQSYRLLFRVTVRAVRVGLRARIRGLGSVFGVKVGLSRSTRTTLVLGLEFRVRVRVFPSTVIGICYIPTDPSSCSAELFKTQLSSDPHQNSRLTRLIASFAVR